MSKLRLASLSSASASLGWVSTYCRSFWISSMGGAPSGAPPPAAPPPCAVSPPGAAGAAASMPGRRRGGWRSDITSCSRYPAMKPTRMPMTAKRTLSLLSVSLTLPPDRPPIQAWRAGGLRRGWNGGDRLSAGGLGPRPLLEARGQGALDDLLGVPLPDTLDVRHLADDEVLGPLVHLLLAERQALALRHEAQVLEHLRHVGQPARLHLV